MAFRLKENDFKALVDIAEHRILTVTQFVAIAQKTKHAVRRRLRDLEKEGLVTSLSRDFGRGRGRPENLLGLTEESVNLLRDRGLIDQNIPYENILGDSILSVNHQLMMNWLRIHLYQVERELPCLTIGFLAHNSPFLQRGQDGRVCIRDISPVPNQGSKQAHFIPDSVFSISDANQHKSCLFFLEVDCGTETIASPRRNMTDIRQKIVNYQWYFHEQRYKRYEAILDCSFHGFRLLFLTNSHSRLTALCRLAEEMKPSNFIWLTECTRLFPDGVSANIWAKGGNLQGPQHSILGSLCCRAPLPASVTSKFNKTS
ncbi:replication-relaxation family protein [Planctomycetota bacterium]